jgi:hypothetical protein
MTSGSRPSPAILTWIVCELSDSPDGMLDQKQLELDRGFFNLHVLDLHRDEAMLKRHAPHFRFLATRMRQWGMEILKSGVLCYWSNRQVSHSWWWQFTRTWKGCWCSAPNWRASWVTESVETNNHESVTDLGHITTKGYVVPGYVDDKSKVATSWVNMVRKKKLCDSSWLVGKRSVAMLTLFTKPKIVNWSSITTLHSHDVFYRIVLWASILDSAV